MGHANRTILLLHPPYGDITYPYHALSYVTAPLRHAGYEVEALDVNVLWFHSLFRRRAVQTMAAEARCRFEQLDCRSTWDFQTQQEAAGLLATMAICSRLRPEHAVNVLQSEAFYDYEHYAWSQQQVQDFERVLTQLYAPYPFATSFSIPPYHPSAAGLVQQVAASGRFKASIVELLGQHLRHDHYLFCGVTIPFTAQTLPGMVLLDALGELLPGTPRVAGGTAVTDIVKASTGRPEVLRAFTHLAEFFFVGEAELGVVDLARWLDTRGGAPPQQVVTLSAPMVQQAPGYVALSAFASKRSASFTPYNWRQTPPEYGWIDWSLYLSPRRHINYSPARGCFWNKCTFCDYGLNGDGPTAPSRTMDANVVVRHMQTLADQGVTDVYFAVDAIEPRFLEKLAQGLTEQRLPLRWSTELFLTPNMDRDFWNLLHRSGLATASFGLESGSSRILEAMGKGPNRVDRVLRPVFEAARHSPVGLQPKYFYGFPGETDTDRERTVELLTEYRDVFSVVTKGNLFDLTEGAYMTKSPQQFGICDIRRKPGDDIGGGMHYRLTSGEPLPTPQSLRRFNDRIAYPSRFERPWAGGIDTLHTKLYIQRFGRDVFHRMIDSGRVEAAHRPAYASVRVDSHFDIESVLTDVRFVDVISNRCTADAIAETLGESAAASLESARAAIGRAETPASYELILN